MNPLQQIGKLGQAIWLDDIHRSLMTSGDLKALIDDDGLCGMTSNPTIFDKAIAGSHDYDDDIRELALEGKGVNDIFEALAIKDVQMAADTFRPLYDRTNGRHGFVSLEVSPHLAHDTGGTLSEGRRLWAALDRPNVFIKVPATLAGLPAIRQLTSDGVNVNITLLFGLPRYRQVAEAYIAGIEERLARSQDVRNVRSVASFFSQTYRRVGRPATRTNQEGRRNEHRSGGKLARPDRHRQRQTSLSDLQGNLSQRPLEEARGFGCMAAMVAVGQYQHEEFTVQRRHVRGFADRPGNGQHPTHPDPGRLSRSRRPQTALGRRWRQCAACT